MSVLAPPLVVTSNFFTCTENFALPRELLYSSIGNRAAFHHTPVCVYSLLDGANDYGSRERPEEVSSALHRMRNGAKLTPYSFFDDPVLSDLIIKVGSKSLYAHRIVLCRSSEYFRSLLTKDFKVRYRVCRELSHGD